MVDWEVFLDVSYYDLWAVRPAGENRLGYTFHVMTKQEADALVLTLLTARQQGRDEGLEEAARGQTLPDAEFYNGQPVEKFTGEAQWEGVIVSAYHTTAGKLRYVVEVKPQGFQMIAVPSQLRAALRKSQGER